MTTARTPEGKLHVTVTAGAGVINTLQFGTDRPLQNAVVDVVGGPSGVTAPRLHSPQTPSVTFLVSRLGGGPVTVPIVVVDACGGWPTFVGMGHGI